MIGDSTPVTVPCSGPDCISPSLVQTFMSPGATLVTLRVRNLAGATSRAFPLMVVPRILEPPSLTLTADSASLITPGHSVTFLLTFSALRLSDLTIQLDTRDGTNISLPSVTSPNREETFFPSCNTKFTFRHRYLNPGVYKPRACVLDDFVFQCVELDGHVQLDTPLDGVGIKGPRILTTRDKAKFSMTSHLNGFSSVQWKLVLENSSNPVAHQHQGETFECHFRTPAIYTIEVTVNNSVSSASAYHTVIVQDAIYDIRMYPSGPVRTGRTTSLMAVFTTGTNVSCSWSTSGSSSCLVEQAGHSCYANYTCFVPGSHNLTLAAWNFVSKAEVQHDFVAQDAVEGLEVFANRTGENVTSFTVSTLGGSNVTGSLVFPTGARVTSALVAGEAWTLVRDEVVDGGVVKAVAFNDVSEREVTVDIQPRGVEPVTLGLFASDCGVTGGVVTYAALTPQGDLGNVQDAVYRWTLTTDYQSSQSTRRYTTVPLIQVQHGVGVRLAVLYHGRRFKVSPSDNHQGSPCLRHSVVARAAYNADSQAQVPPDWLLPAKYSVVQLAPSSGECPNDGVGQPQRWQHALRTAGVFQFRSEPVSSGQAVGDTTWLVVQDPLPKLVIHGPRRLRIDYLPISATWTVRHQAGPDHVTSLECNPGLLYQWSTGGSGSAQTITASNKFSPVLTSPGVLVLKVKVQSVAWNRTVSAQLSVRVMSAVREVQVSCPVSMGSFRLTLTGSPDFEVRIDYGDGLTKTLTRQTRGVSYRQLNSSCYEYLFNHTYKTRGRYVVKTNVSNAVSWQTRDSLVLVDKGIGKVRLVAETSPNVALFETVVVTAIVDHDPRGLLFEWDFGDQSFRTNVTSTEHGSRATHFYSIAGLYSIHLKVWTPSFTQHTVQVRLPHNIHAVDPVFQLHLAVTTTCLALERTSEGYSSTPQAEFRATVTHGSEVSVLFDFGDGTRRNVPIDHAAIMFSPVAETKHAYRKEGVYKVTAQASNPLSTLKASLCQDVHVLVLPSALRLAQSVFVSRRNLPLTLRASINQGTNVTFNWYIGDTVFATGTGPSINITFKRTGHYMVKVEAQNLATDLAFPVPRRPAYLARVKVQDVIQGVEVCATRFNSTSVVCFMEGVELVLPLDKEVRLSARVTPGDVTNDLNFVWETGDGAVFKRTAMSSCLHVYQAPGWYPVNVTVRNQLNAVRSGPLWLHLVERVSNLTLRSTLVLTRDQRATFTALYRQGSDLTFEWNFGDGSPVQYGSNTSWHQYRRLGEFQVTAKASNVFGSSQVSTTVFVVKEGSSCSQPQLTLVDQCQHQILTFSDPVRLEADLNVSCQTGHSALTGTQSRAVFRWTLVGSLNWTSVESLPEDVTERREVYLPPGTLPVDLYQVKLKVQLQGTVVYSEVSTTLRVQADLPVAMIRGGLFRTVSSTGTLDMDSSESYLPLQGEQPRFRWSCVEFRSSRPCFLKDGTRPTALSTLSVHAFTFPASWLNPDLKTFLFNLTLDLQGSSSSVTQVVERIDTPRVLMVEIACLNCRQKRTTSQETAVFQALCSNCGGRVPEYHWELWRVRGDPDPDDIPAIPHLNGDVSYSTEFREDDDDDDEEEGDRFNIRFENSGGRGDSHWQRMNEFQTRVSDSSRRRNMRELSEPMGGRWKGHLDSHPPFLKPVEEGPHYQNASHDPFSDPDVFAPVRNGGHHRVPELAEGYPGEEGSAPSRNHFGPKSSEDGHIQGSADGIHIEEGQTNGRGDLGSGDTGPGLAGGRPGPKDTLEDPRRAPTVPHLLSRPRTEISLKDVAATRGPYLAIPAGVLLPGRVYLVKARAQFTDSAESGSVMDSLLVPLGPSRGRCTVHPSEGSPLTTTFRLHCLEWRSDRPPLQYMVHYSLRPRGQRWLVHRGLNRNVRFPLPSGLGQHDHTVFLHVTLEDSFGASTPVHINQPRVWPHSDETKEFGAPSWTFPNSTLTKLALEGNTQSVLHHLHVIATLLNTSQDSEDKQILVTRVLALLAGLRVYGRYEYVQALSTLEAVSYSISGPVELEEAASLLLDLFNESGGSNPASDPFLLSATNQIMDRYLEMRARFGKEGRDRMLAWVRHVVDQVLVMRLKSLLPTEDCVSIDTSRLAALACTLRGSTLQGAMPAFNFTVAPWHRSYSENCSSLLVEYYDYNIWESDEIHSVVFLKQINCSGSTETGAEVEIVLGVPAQTQPSEIFDVQAGLLNVHHLNISDDHLNSSLSVLVDFLPLDSDQEGLDSQLQVLFGVSQSLLPSDHIIRKSVADGPGDLEFFVPGGYIKEGIVPHLSVMLSSTNQNPDEDVPAPIRKYTLSVRGQDCAFKVDGTPDADQMCTVSPDTTRERLVCRCPQLGGVGFAFWPVASVLSVHSLDDLLVSSFHPSAVTLVSAFLAIYILVLISSSWTSDRLARQRPSLVQLAENKPWERNHYLVTVRTGCFWDSGTTAAVFLVLHGDQGLSRSKKLQSPGGVFQRSGTDHFLFSTEKTLGNLWKVQVWHDNAGDSPSWYLRDITVRNLISEHCWFFDCEKWLSAGAEDGQIEMEFHLAKDPIPITKAFQKTLIASLSDFHLWGSVFSSPLGSQLSRCQRLSTCLSTLLTTSALAAWTASGTKVSSFSDLYLGLPHQSFTSASLSSVTTFLLHLLLTLSFRLLPYHHPSWPFPIPYLYQGGICPLLTSCWRRVLPGVKRTSRDDRNEPTPSSLSSGGNEGENDFYPEDEEGETRQNPFHRESGISLSSSLNHWHSIEMWARRKRFKLPSMIGQSYLDKELGDAVSMETRSLRSYEESEESESLQGTALKMPPLPRKKKRLRCLCLQIFLAHLFWPLFVFSSGSLSFFIISFTRKFSTSHCILWFQTITLAFLIDYLLLQPLLVLVTSVALTWRSRIMGYNRWLDVSGQRAVKKAHKVITTLELTSAFPPPDCHRMESYHHKPAEELLNVERTNAIRSRRMTVFVKRLSSNVVVTILILIVAFGRFNGANFDQARSINNFLKRSQMPAKCTATEFLNWSLTSLPGRLFEEASGPTYATGSVLIGQPSLDLCSGSSCRHVFESLVIASPENNSNMAQLEQVLNVSKNYLSGFTIITKFVLYNPASNVFSCVMARSHFWNTGPAQIDSSVSPVHLTKNKDTDWISLAEILFFLVVAYHTKTEMWKLSKQGRSYFSLSSLVLASLWLSSYVFLFLLLLYSSCAQPILQELRQTKTVAFWDMHSLVSLEWSIQVLLGFMLLLESFLWLSVAQFVPAFQLASKTLSGVWKELVGILFLFLVLLLGHSVYSCLTLPTSVPWRRALEALCFSLRHGPRSIWTDHPGYDFSMSVYCFALIAILFFTAALVKASLVECVHRRRRQQSNPKVTFQQLSFPFRQKLAKKPSVPPASAKTMSGSSYPPLEFLLHELEKALEEIQSRSDRLFPDSLLTYEQDDEDGDFDTEISSPASETAASKQDSQYSPPSSGLRSPTLTSPACSLRSFHSSPASPISSSRSPRSSSPARASSSLAPRSRSPTSESTSLTPHPRSPASTIPSPAPHPRSSARTSPFLIPGPSSPASRSPTLSLRSPAIRSPASSLRSPVRSSPSLPPRPSCSVSNPTSSPGLRSPTLPPSQVSPSRSPTCLLRSTSIRNPMRASPSHPPRPKSPAKLSPTCSRHLPLSSSSVQHRPRSPTRAGPSCTLRPPPSSPARASPACKVRRTKARLNPDSLPASPVLGVLIRRTKSKGKGKSSGLQLEGLLDSEDFNMD